MSKQREEIAAIVVAGGQLLPHQQEWLMDQLVAAEKDAAVYSAAKELCRAEDKLRDIRRILTRCQYFEPFDSDTGNFVPKCEPPTINAGDGAYDDSELCEACKIRFAWEPGRKALIKARRSAKAKMLRAHRKAAAIDAARAQEGHDGE